MQLTQQEEAMIQAAQKTPFMEVLRKVVQQELDTVSDINTIDPNGNMGLQALAAQKSHAALTAIFQKLKLVDPAAGTKAKGPRQYQ